MLIKVTTNYGHAMQGRVILKTPASEPFSVDDAKGRELIERGIAVEVEDDAELEAAAEEALRLSAKTRAELADLAAAHGIKVTSRASKTDILAALEAEGIV